MSSGGNKAIVRRFIDEVWNKRDFAVLDELVAPDYTWRNASATAAAHGPQFLKRIVTELWSACPDAAHSIEDMLAEGDRVVTRVVMRGTHQGDLPWGPHDSIIKPTGKKVTVGGILISRIADGRIVEDWEGFEFANLWQQLGALPAPE